MNQRAGLAASLLILVSAWQLFLAGCGADASRTGGNSLDPPQTAGSFTLTGNMADVHIWHTATLLPDGKVLIACGAGDSGDGALSDLPEAELFNPTTGAFTSFPATPRTGCTATLLPNGKVLLTGGLNNGQVNSSAELFDPGTGLFQPTGNMTSPRVGHTATPLSNGKVLIAGGSPTGATHLEGVALVPGPPSPTAELYDPASGTFTSTGDMLAARAGHTATSLQNGNVLIAGGDGPGSAELFDPSTGAFSATGSMTTFRAGHTATLLPNGKVFIAGGIFGPPDGFVGVMGAVTETYDPATGSFASAGNMVIPRLAQTATLLRNGTVLLTGGATQDATSGACSTDGAEIYDPAKASFTQISNMNQARSAHSATLLGDGSVLITGGFHCVVGESNSGPLRTAEIYE